MRDDLMDLLARWEAGEYDPEAVRDQAELICNAFDWERTPAMSSSLREVCSQLEALHLQLITKEDIPPLRALLTTGGSGDAAMRAWAAYFENVDLRARAEALSDDSFYGDGARSILSKRMRRSLK